MRLPGPRRDRVRWRLARWGLHALAARPGLRTALSDLVDSVQRAPLATRLFRLAACCGRPGLYLVEVFLAVAAGIHLAAGSVHRCYRTARIMNLLFRDRVRRCEGMAARAYFLGLLEAGDFARLTRSLRGREVMPDPVLNRIIGEAHMRNDAPIPAARCFRRLVEQQPDDHHAHRLLGSAEAVQGNLIEAAAAFERSVALLPASVMAYQNAAGRYDISGYRPPAWEVAEAGRLLVYDALARQAEALTNNGLLEAGLACSRRLLAYQADLAAMRGLPADLVARLAAACPEFDRSLPIRILSYEWVTQIGHIGMLALQAKMAALGMLPRANRLVLAPGGKVANDVLLGYLAPHFHILRDADLVTLLLPWQRVFGDGFMIVRTTDGGVEPWTIAAARAEARWAEEGRPPLLRLTEADDAFGRQALRRLGIAPDAWLTGLHVRERGFHREAAGSMGDHRNAAIGTYLPACAEIARRGGHVLRFGDRTMRRLPRDSALVDYATSPAKSARMDVFLLARAQLLIGTTSGLTTAAQAFGTPMLLVNCLSGDWQCWPDNCRFLVKQLHDRRAKRRLSLAETYRPPVQGWLANSLRLCRQGFDVLDNTEQEIHEAVVEVLTGAAPVPALYADFQTRLRDNPRVFGMAKPATSFLAANPHLLAAE